MRMWNIPAALLCDKHLMGEHVELHMFVGSIKKGTSISGYVRDGLFDPGLLEHRHEMLVAEIGRRGMRHNSPLISPTRSDVMGTVDSTKNLAELVRRCVQCRHRIEEEMGRQWEHIPRGGDAVTQKPDGEWVAQMTGQMLPGSHKTRAKALQCLERARR